MNASFILVAATIFYCLIHSLTASNPVKQRVRRWLGPGADRWYRLVYNLWAGISFLPILWLLWYLPDRKIYTIPMPWLLLTIAIQLCGAAIIVLGMLQTGALTFLGIMQVFKSGKRSDSPLVTAGLYATVRHPLYTGGLLILWASPVLSRNLLTLFILITIYLVIGARLEEGRMLQEYGEAYARYQEEVPMLFPRLIRKD